MAKAIINKTTGAHIVTPITPAGPRNAPCTPLPAMQNIPTPGLQRSTYPAGAYEGAPKPNGGPFKGGMSGGRMGGGKA